MTEMSETSPQTPPTRKLEDIDQDYRNTCLELGNNLVLSLRIQTQKEELLKRIGGLLEESRLASTIDATVPAPLDASVAKV